MMKKTSTYTDENFLNGHLKIMTDETRKITLGKFTFYDEDSDKIIAFTAVTKCDEEDIYNESTGIDIIKLKLVKQYYSYKKRSTRHVIDRLNSLLKDTIREYTFASKKLNNTKKALSKYGFTFYDYKEENNKNSKKKPVEKKTTKTTSRRRKA